MVIDDVTTGTLANTNQKSQMNQCLFVRQHGHGFIDATSINEAGHSVEYFALEIEIVLSSKGSLITSNTLRLNSGSSSRKSTPLWARLISPGCGLVLPPTKATAHIYDNVVG